MKYLAMNLTLVLLALSMMGQADTSLQSSNFPVDQQTFIVPALLKTSLKDYRSRFIRLSGYEYSPLHWKQFVIIFTNQGINQFRNNYLEYIRVFEEDLDIDIDETHFQIYPAGTIIVKESYAVDLGKPGAPLFLSIMRKNKPGYDNKHGDWEYIQADTKGNIIVQGNSSEAVVVNSCQSCHENVSHRDYIFSTLFSQVLQK